MSLVERVWWPNSEITVTPTMTLCRQHLPVLLLSDCCSAAAWDDDPSFELRFPTARESGSHKSLQENQVVISHCKRIR